MFSNEKSFYTIPIEMKIFLRFLLNYLVVDYIEVVFIANCVILYPFNLGNVQVIQTSFI